MAPENLLLPEISFFHAMVVSFPLSWLLPTSIVYSFTHSANTPLPQEAHFCRQSDIH